MTCIRLWLRECLPQQLVHIATDCTVLLHACVPRGDLCECDCSPDPLQALDLGGVGPAEALHEWMDERHPHSDLARCTSRGRCTVAQRQPLLDRWVERQLDR